MTKNFLAALTHFDVSVALFFAKQSMALYKDFNLSSVLSGEEPNQLTGFQLDSRKPLNVRPVAATSTSAASNKGFPARINKNELHN